MTEAVGWTVSSDDSPTDREHVDGVAARVSVNLPPLRRFLSPSELGWAPATALIFSVLATYSLVLTSRFGFLDDYWLLHQMAVDPASVSDHIIGGGRPFFAIAYRLLIGQVEGIDGLRWVRATSLIGTCIFALFLYRLLRCANVSTWAATGIALLVVSLPCYQVAAVWATMFIMPFAAVTGLAASVAVSRLVLDGRMSQPRAWLLPFGLLAGAMVAYQPAAMTFCVGFAILLFAPTGVLARTRTAVSLALAHAGVMAGALLAGFVALRIGVATQAVTGDRSGTATDIVGKATWFVTESLARALDPWALTPRPSVAIAVPLLVGAGLSMTVEGRSRRIIAVGTGALLLPMSYVPNLVVAENWASTRSLIALMPMVAVLAALSALAALRTMPFGQWLPRHAGAMFMCAVALAFAVQARSTVDRWFVRPQQEELAVVEAAIRQTAGQQEPLHIVLSSWSDSIAPSLHYDEFGVPSSCRRQPALGLTQLIVREQTGRFADVRIMTRGERPIGPFRHAAIDFHALLAGAPTG